MSSNTQKYCVDANVLITAWHHTYPPTVFKSLWNQLQGSKTGIILIKEIFDEIEPLSAGDRKNLTQQQLGEKYPLRLWLENNQFSISKTQDLVCNIALSLEQKYKTKDQGTGASQNDILLIAYAKFFDTTVVTLEAKQLNHPQKNKQL